MLYFSGFTYRKFSYIILLDAVVSNPIGFESIYFSGNACSYKGVVVILLAFIRMLSTYKYNGQKRRASIHVYY